MEASNDIMIRISPNEGKITVEEDAQGCLLPGKASPRKICFGASKTACGQQTRAITAVSCR